MILEKLDKSGKQMFTKEYKDTKMVDALLTTYAKYPTGELQWRLVEEEKPRRSRKSKENEDTE